MKSIRAHIFAATLVSLLTLASAAHGGTMQGYVCSVYSNFSDYSSYVPTPAFGKYGMVKVRVTENANCTGTTRYFVYCSSGATGVACSRTYPTVTLRHFATTMEKIGSEKTKVTVTHSLSVYGNCQTWLDPCGVESYFINYF